MENIPWDNTQQVEFQQTSGNCNNCLFHAFLQSCVQINLFPTQEVNVLPYKENNAVNFDEDIWPQLHFGYLFRDDNRKLCIANKTTDYFLTFEKYREMLNNSENTNGFVNENYRRRLRRYYELFVDFLHEIKQRKENGTFNDKTISQYLNKLPDKNKRSLENFIRWVGTSYVETNLKNLGTIVNKRKQIEFYTEWVQELKFVEAG